MNRRIERKTLLEYHCYYENTEKLSTEITASQWRVHED